ncbi:MAG: hypothetical protein AAFY46_02910 [Planctomycetota bacterium]
MTTDPNILALIARSGLTEADLLGFVEGELPADRAAAVVRVLGEHPELSRTVMAMRGDRNELGHELELIAARADAAFVDSVVYQGVTGEIDPEFAARLEAGGGSIPRMRPTRVVRASRLRFHARSVGTLLAACLALAFFGAIWAAWPSSPASSTTSQQAEAPAQVVPELDAAPVEQAEVLVDAPALAAPPVEPSLPEWGPTTLLSTPAEALAAAQEGRLVIRVFSPDAERGRGLVESITTAPSVSRVAVLQGRMADHAADRIAEAIPVPTGPVFAADPGAAPAPAGPSPDRASWVYMIEVEPTERGMSLLISGLSRERGMLVEMLRSDAPVTTPGSAGDVSWFRKPSRDWTHRIAAPVVVQSVQR